MRVTRQSPRWSRLSSVTGRRMVRSRETKWCRNANRLLRKKSTGRLGDGITVNHRRNASLGVRPGFQPKPHFGRCYEAAQMPMGRICVAHSGPKVPWPRLLTRPRGCTKTCGMPKAVHGAVPNPFRMVPGLRCTISSGGVIPRACFSGLSPRLGYTFIRNCNSCV